MFKHYPLPFHKDAPLAHEATAAAHQQGRFWEYHDKLFEGGGRALDRATLERHAQELGLDMARFRRDLDSGRMKAIVDADLELGNSLGRMGTPTFYINGRKISGARPFEQFKQVIDEELKAKGAGGKGTG